MEAKSKKIASIIIGGMGGMEGSGESEYSEEKENSMEDKAEAIRYAAKSAIAAVNKDNPLLFAEAIKTMVYLCSEE